MDFHLMNRGARRNAIFRDDEDRELFVDLLGREACKHGLRLCAWCLMPNHFHFQSRADGPSVTRWPDAYRWSSCRAYLGLEPAPLWLDLAPVLGSADPDVPADPDEYAAYLEAAPPRRKKRKTPESQFEDALLDQRSQRAAIEA